MSASLAAAAAERRIRSLRGPKPAFDPWKPHGALIEQERRGGPGGEIERALTIFLAGSECPFTCSFCDLWRWTIDGPTPLGALPRQIAESLRSLDDTAAAPDRLKLYNASNFFDRRAVPIEDLPEIASLCAPFAGVTVESHANTVGDVTLEFARLIPGRLEVAMGLETIHPLASAQLNKRLDLGRFDRAARFLCDSGIDLRVFVLLGAPYVPVAESVDWAVRAATYAAERGASVASIIPVRGGNGELERLEALGHFTPPTLSQLEAALDQCIAQGPSRTVFTADLWDVNRLPACEACRSARVERLRQLNITGTTQRPVACNVCRS